MRLIDADALIKEYLDKFWEACADDKVGSFDAIGTMTKIIEQAPTIEERPHGEWKDIMKITYATCSNCGEFGVCGYFCTWCGAKMGR